MYIIHTHTCVRAIVYVLHSDTVCLVISFHSIVRYINGNIFRRPAAQIRLCDLLYIHDILYILSSDNEVIATYL